MRKMLASAFAILLVVGCGGGGGNPGTCSGSAMLCAANTSASENSNTVSTPIISTQTTTLCNVVVGTKLLTGPVTDVHDGDSITLDISGTIYKIRLDSIDAPELAQPFGNESQMALKNSVLGKTVKVAYTKTDQYDRIVGAVFTDTCQYVNLNQVATGMAWFYKAYQCEISADLRSQFAQAQDNAVNAQLGLWSQTDPEAPWFYRNGVEPVTPICKSDAPSWEIGFALTSVGATAPANSSYIVTSPSGTTRPTCYTGPRGGTYTITSSGNKNYGGC